MSIPFYLSLSGRRRTARRCAYMVAASCIALSTPSLAQDAPMADDAQAVTPSDDAPPQDIIVTARKRSESLIAVPVTITAVGQETLERRGIVRLEELNTLVPGLQLGDASGGFQGGTIFLRGLGAGDANTFADQAVPFVIDDAQIGRATIRRLSEVDVGQIQVLKGPQTLFFGKSTPAGAIVISTNDPTDRFEARGRAGYEFNAHQLSGEAVVSGPLIENIGARLAAFGSTSRGWMKNGFPQDNPLTGRPHGPRENEYGGRLTVKYLGDDDLTVRLKINYSHLENDGSTGAVQNIFCPMGASQYGDPQIECVPDSRYQHSNVPPSFVAIDTNFGDGRTYLKMDQLLAPLSIDYELSDSLTLSSVSSFYSLKQRQVETFNNTLAPGSALGLYAHLNFKEFTQELRLLSAFDGPINFLTGAFYHYSNLFAQTSSGAFAPPRSLGSIRARQRGNAYSAFLQGILKPTEAIELAAGGRYSEETKRVDFELGVPPGIFAPVATGVPRRRFTDFSPELTATWRPTQQLTIFGGYREGFLSGGFNSGFADVSGDRSYGQQNTKGFEGGIKASLFNRTLRTNLSIYSYTTTGMQLTISFTPPTGGAVLRTVNAGKSRTTGIEGEFAWTTPISGLDVRGAMAYNHGRYKDFQTLCYQGQTVALGCNVSPNAAGRFQLQDLSGQQMVRAPDWMINGGATYTRPVGPDLVLDLNADAAYTSGYFTTTTNIPASRMPGYWQVSGSIAIHPDDDRWRVALIGKNLTNEYYYSRTAEQPLQGTPGGLTTGTRADLSGTVSRGRQILMQVSVKY
ncbi:TonB-dependent receptor [Sphingobium tyrosinilyticum]|uniref:TonB-dependent receptor n=1 Tax=Sphingobium tyrosinilyticum TaxID=2715436 RepID=A0ABV9F0S1_9SPHN